MDWFFIGMLVFTVFVLLVSVSSESVGGLLAFLGMVIADILYLSMSSSFVNYIVDHPFTILLAAGSYLVLGVLWSIFRFYLFYSKEVRKLVDGKTEWLKKNVIATWPKYVDDNSPQVRKCKSKIVCWIAYWPLSIVGFICCDLCRDLFVFVYNRITYVYDEIARSIREAAKV